MKYLQEEQYYIDIYDLSTIKECLGYKEKAFSGDLPKFKGKKFSPKQSKSMKQGLTDFMLYFIKGDRYRNKASRIREWMDKDHQEQEKFDNTPEPTILCSSCGERMVCYSKILEDRSEQPLKVLFFLKCPSCQNRKGIYDTGEEFISKPTPCPKCSNLLKVSVTESKTGTIVTWIRKCSSCEFSETEVEGLEKKRVEWDKKEKKDKKLLKKANK